MTINEARDSGFIGRQDEMAVLTAVLDEVLSGIGQMAMLAGEPGIGKTRLAQELANHSESKGARVLWGRCYEEQGVPPYWPWVQAIRSHVREIDPEQLRSEIGAGAADIAGLVPDVKEKFPDIGPPSQMESPEQTQFRMFDLITTFLKTASQKQPLVVVLDDLQWADLPSLQLLRFVTRELDGTRLMLLGTYRDVELNRQHPLVETLGELTRERLFQRLRLQGLAREDVARLIEITSGKTADQGLVEAVHSQTEGNALFVTEIVRMLEQEGELSTGAMSGSAQGEDKDSWTIRIPEGVREVIGRRLNRLSDHCNEALTVASVIGREFTLDQLRPLVEDFTEDQLLGVLEEALAGRAIEETSDTVGHYQFAHALIQETLTSELSLTQRVRLHARIAETLETGYGLEAETHAAELAYHFAQAQTVTGAEKVVQYSILAGERAVNVQAYDEALVHFQMGLTAKGIALTGSEPAEDEEAAALLAGLGHAQLGTHDRSNSRQVAVSLTRAFDYYLSIGNSERALATALSDLPIVTSGLEFVERALALVPPDTIEAGRLQARLIFPFRTDYGRSQEAFHNSLSIAREQQDKLLEMKALVAAACVDYHYSNNAQSLERNLQAIALAQFVDLPNEESHARYDLNHVLFAVGNLEEATLHAEAMLAAAERTRSRIWHDRAMDANVILNSAKGDWPTARTYIDQVLETSPRDSVILGAGALLECQLGESDASDAYLQRLIDNVPGGWPSSPAAITLVIQGSYTVPTVVIPAVAYITGRMVHFDLVETVANAIFSLPVALPAYLHAARIGLGLIAVQRQDETAAR